MKIFALADLHLSLAKPKPMDVFGPAWTNHHLRIAENWQRLVTPEDLVLVCGDISWAMHLEEAEKDLNFLTELPGKKVLIRGNHDYWWKSISKVRSKLPEGIAALQNDYIAFGDIAVCGTRGWSIPNGQLSEEDKAIYLREILRAELSLNKAEKDGFQKKIFMLHFPPFLNGLLDPGFKELFANYGVHWCVYGHMHGNDHRFAVEGSLDGVQYVFVAADFTGFAPVELLEMNRLP